MIVVSRYVHSTEHRGDLPVCRPTIARGMSPLGGVKDSHHHTYLGSVPAIHHWENTRWRRTPTCSCWQDKWTIPPLPISLCTCWNGNQHLWLQLLQPPRDILDFKSAWAEGSCPVGINAYWNHGDLGQEVVKGPRNDSLAAGCGSVLLGEVREPYGDPCQVAGMSHRQRVRQCCVHVPQ